MIRFVIPLILLSACATPEKKEPPDPKKPPFVMVELSTATWKINENGWPVVCFVGDFCAEPSIEIQEHYLRKSCSYHKRALILMNVDPESVVVTPACVIE